MVRQLGPDGTPVTGERVVNEVEAGIVRRIFESFAAGISPKAIARQFNVEGIPGPRGKLWRDTAIRGHRQRGTGILNNELYVGRLVWNRMRYVKDPSTGKRVSRLNPREDWIVTEVPELRIIDDALWDRVKQRQETIDSSSRVQGIKASRFWERRRKDASADRSAMLRSLRRRFRIGGQGLSGLLRGPQARHLRPAAGVQARCSGNGGPRLAAGSADAA